MSAVKSLLGVRSTTTNDVCLIEAGLPALSAIIRSRQAKFLHEICESRASLEDDPLMFALKLTEDGNKPMHKKITDIRASANSDHISEDIAAWTRSMKTNKGTKFATYVKINPALETHRLYSDMHSLPDNLRIIFTRFRTSSHRLRVELGRWSRIPSDQRTCSCGSGDIQDEAHVFVCQLTRDTRQRANFVGGCKELFVETNFANLNMLKDCLHILESE